MGYSGAGGKLIHEKNQKQKISWHCLFGADPDRIGYLENPQQSSIPSPPRASSRARYPTFPTRKCRYEAIRVWSYTTFISCRSQSWDNLRVESV